MTSNVTKLDINGSVREFHAPAEMPLLWALRDLAGLTGTKYGCGGGFCGACTVHLDGQPVRSCLVPIGSLTGRRIRTIEGIGSNSIGQIVQAAWIAEDVPQCGYCQSGQIMSAVALLSGNPAPTDTEVEDAMNGNLCRCGAYDRIRKAIARSVQSLP